MGNFILENKSFEHVTIHFPTVNIKYYKRIGQSFLKHLQSIINLRSVDIPQNHISCCRYFLHPMIFLNFFKRNFEDDFPFQIREIVRNIFKEN